MSEELDPGTQKYMPFSSLLLLFPQGERGCCQSALCIDFSDRLGKETDRQIQAKKKKKSCNAAVRRKERKVEVSRKDPDFPGARDQVELDRVFGIDCPMPSSLQSTGKYPTRSMPSLELQNVYGWFFLGKAKPNTGRNPSNSGLSTQIILLDN